MELQNTLSILGITTTVSQSYNIPTAGRFNSRFSTPNPHTPASTPPGILKKTCTITQAVCSDNANPFFDGVKPSSLSPSPLRLISSVA